MSAETIRPMAVEELPRLIPFGEDFLASCGQTGFEPERFLKFWGDLMQYAGAVIYLAEDQGEVQGAMGMIPVPDPYRMGLIAQEGFWYVRPERRGTRLALRLFAQYERWAREIGATECRVASMHGQHYEALSRYFYAHGYQPFEHAFMKRI